MNDDRAGMAADWQWQLSPRAGLGVLLEEVLVGRRITSALALGVSYQDNSFAFGSARMASFVVTVGF